MNEWNYRLSEWIHECVEAQNIGQISEQMKELQAAQVNRWLSITTGLSSEELSEGNFRLTKWTDEWAKLQGYQVNSKRFELQAEQGNRWVSNLQGYQVNRWAYECGTAGLQSEGRGGHVLCLIVKYLPRGAAGFCVYIPPRLQSFNEIRVSHSFESHET